MKARATNHTIDIIVEMLDGWRRHLSGRNASLLAFFTFLSIFPLMLAATSILGLVLEGNDELLNRIIDSAADEIPVIGADLKSDPDSINGSLWVVVVGIAGALWSSTKAFVGLQGALDDIWEIPVDDRHGMPEQRGRAIIGLLILGTAQVGSITITAIVNAANLPGISQILVALGTMVVNIVVIASMYRFLTSASPSPSFGDVWPGAIMAGVIFSVLHYSGPRLVETVTKNASDTYGTFAIVLGLITWLGFVAIGTLMAAELNTAIVRRRDAGPYPTMGPEFDLPIGA